MSKKAVSLLLCLLSIILIFSSCSTAKDSKKTADNTEVELPNDYIASVNDVPAFSESPYIAIRNNEPDFENQELVTKSYETYSELDALGRCGVVMACIGTDIMPTEDRGSIGQVKPTGWHTVKYDFVDGKYLYNRCHLIGFQLTGENANERNLITGTRYLNIEGMLPFENMIADYVKETENHVIYRVTPIYDGNNLIARGVQMEGYSVEDDGEGICFNVYAYNNQPGVVIDYATGESRLDDGTSFENNEPDTNTDKKKYVLNTSSKKIHLPSCSSVGTMSENNKKISNESRNELISKGYSPCKNCNP